MVLSLRITSYQQASLGSDSQVVFDRKGGTVGRNQGNDWVLPDTERYLSGKHALIEYRAGNYFLTDTSTNGVYFGDSEQALGQGNSVQLNNGDQLYMGDYEILVIIGEQAAEEVEPIGGNAELTWLEQTGEVSPAVSERHGLTSSREEAVDEAAFFPDILEPDSPLWEHEEHKDILSDRSEGSAVEEAELTPGGITPEAPPWKEACDEDLFVSSPEEQESEPDHIGSDRQFFRPPEAKFEKIPEDWDITGISVTQEKEPSLDEAPEEIAGQSSHGISPQSRRDHAEEAGSPEAESVTGNVKPPGSENLPPLNIPAAEPQPHSTPDSQPRPPKSVPSSISRGGGAGAVQAFLKGTGLDPAGLPPGEAEVFMEQLGQIFRQVVASMMDVLMARSQLKSEFRLELTMIRPSENNPLKFSVGVTEALEYLLFQKSKGFLPPVEAFRECFRDLKDHELAMMAGMRAVFEQTMSRFEPDSLVKKFGDESAGWGLLSMSRKAKYWEQYCEAYKKLAMDAEDHFQEFFGAEFAQAYEDQISQLEEFRKSKGQ